MSRVTWRGRVFDDRTARMLAEVAKLSGPIYINPTQGSYSGGVAASAGTHNGGGAVDLMHPSWSVSDYNKVVALMRKVGFAAWHRTPQQSNWPRHVHGIAVQPGGRNDKGVLSTGALNQVKNYYDGRNGLASGARDDGPRQYVNQTWEKYLKTAAQEADVTTLGYSGKPSGNIRLKGDGRYVTLDAHVAGPSRGGKREDRLVYLNVGNIEWALPKSDPMYYFQTASLRVRFQRARHNGKPEDNTAYQDFTITPWRSSFLVTHVHWETGEAGRGGRWHLNLVGHAKNALVGTRYAKGAQE